MVYLMHCNCFKNFHTIFDFILLIVMCKIPFFICIKVYITSSTVTGKKCMCNNVCKTFSLFNSPISIEWYSITMVTTEKCLAVFIWFFSKRILNLQTANSPFKSFNLPRKFNLYISIHEITHLPKC